MIRIKHNKTERKNKTDYDRTEQNRTEKKKQIRNVTEHKRAEQNSDIITEQNRTD